MGHTVSLSTPNGPLSAWRADPAGPAKGALVVVQEIFGLNAHIRGVVDRFAEAGFVAIAPALSVWSAMHLALHRQHLPEAQFAVWPAGHGFNCEMRADFHPPSAQAALAQTLAFFATHLQ